tara:strand:+ start:360 stop:764 length:405 start_codon:yes stop_codon:yes gene_type:complete
MMGKKKTAMKRGGPVKKRGGGMMGKKKMAKGGPVNQHKRMAMGETVNMKDGGTMMYSRGYGVGEKGKRTPTTILDGMKKGGRVKKKKQGYKDRKDESIAMRIKKKRTKKQLKASRDDSYGKFGSKARKKGKINR